MNEKQEKDSIWYKDLVEIGFERFDMNCQIAKNQYGYDDFYLFLKMGKNMEIHWHPQNPKTAELVRFKKSNVLNRAVLCDIETIKAMIAYFNTDEGKPPAPLRISKSEIA